MKTIYKVSCALTIICALFSVIQLLQVTAFATTAVQQCAGYALACALVIVPYCVSKSLKGLGD